METIEQPALTKRRIYLLLTGLLLAQMIGAIEGTVLATAAPTIAADLKGLGADFTLTAQPCILLLCATSTVTGVSSGKSLKFGLTPYSLSIASCSLRLNRSRMMISFTRDGEIPNRRAISDWRMPSANKRRMSRLRRVI